MRLIRFPGELAIAPLAQSFIVLGAVLAERAPNTGETLEGPFSEGGSEAGLISGLCTVGEGESEASEGGSFSEDSLLLGTWSVCLPRMPQVVCFKSSGDIRELASSVLCHRSDDSSMIFGMLLLGSWRRFPGLARKLEARCE